MTNYINRNLRQTVTYWRPTGNDRFGGKTFAAPTTQLGRWEERTDLFIDRTGKETRSMARIYLTDDVELGGYLYLGTSSSTAPENVDGAYEIRDFRKTPNLRATLFERRALI